MQSDIVDIKGTKSLQILQISVSLLGSWIVFLPQLALAEVQHW